MEGKALAKSIYYLHYHTYTYNIAKAMFRNQKFATQGNYVKQSDRSRIMPRVVLIATV